LPLVASVPLQLPDAVQLVALTEDQVIVVELPEAMELAANVRAGATGGATAVTVTELFAEVPLALIQVSV
jgi:hypothetical protein